VVKTPSFGTLLSAGSSLCVKILTACSTVDALETAGTVEHGASKATDSAAGMLAAPTAKTENTRDTASNTEAIL
jgi:hypothetical protein